MQHLRLTIILLLPLFGFSQNFFESGYYIDNTGKKQVGLIDNERWKNTPDAFNFKSSESANVEVVPIDKAVEFGIGESVKYVRKSIMVDKNRAVNVTTINTSFLQPQFERKTAYLKVLAEGAANLYLYTHNEDPKYFVSAGDTGEPVQLVYKKFIDTDSKVKETWDYRRTLYENFRCEDKDVLVIKKLGYSQAAFRDYINSYNSCKGGASREYTAEKGKTNLKFTAMLGVGLSTFGVIKMTNFPFQDETKMVIIPAVEASVIFPSNRNRYELFARLSVQSLAVENFSEKQTTSTGYMQDVAKTDLRNISIGIGPRWNFVVNDNSRIFLEGMLGFSMVSGDFKIDTYRYTGTTGNLQQSESLSVKGDLLTNVGIGYVYKGKYGIVINSDIIEKDIVQTNMFISGTSYRTISASLRYTIN